ncbi:MAG: hypothetical protein Q8M74_05795, partial [Chloroflexota bacterium]|nr:hypothetical protein [Chloroflexota bacterium]
LRHRLTLRLEVPVMTSPGQSEGRRVFRFLRTFGVALVGILVAAWLGTKALGFLGAGFDYGAPRPTPATLQGYQLSYKVATADWTPLAVDAEARACGVLAASTLLRDSCVLAVNVDPRWIAAPAFGTLNSEDTPSYLAITWRAVLAGDPSLCT